MPRGDKKALLEFEFELPNIDEQHLIVESVDPMVKKIELNTQMNQTLEKIAQRIFKSWFIDFEPVKANAEGVPFDGLSPDIQSLFPSEFVESEMGLIPKGWEVKDLSECIDILNGFAFKSKDYTEKGNFVLRTKNFDSGLVKRAEDDVFLPDVFIQSHEKYLCQHLDYHLVMVGASIGKRALIFEHQLPALRNQNMWCFRPKQNSYLSRCFIKCLLDRVTDGRLGLASGSAREFFRKGDFGSIKIIVPPKSVMKQFEEVADTLLEKISVNSAQSDALAKIRDKLLPKLLSGSIEINELDEAS